MTLRTMNKSSTITDEVRPEAVTWTSHVFGPMAQNIFAGLGAAGLGLIGFGATQSWRHIIWYVDDAIMWCSFLGGAVTCTLTLIRFAGDELDIIGNAYRAGQRSRDGQVNALMLEIRTLRDATHAAQADGTASSAVKRESEFMTRARNDAGKLIKVHFNGENITRAAMGDRGMGQRDWERATRLLKASGVMDNDYVIVAVNPTQALRALDERISEDRSRGDKFNPSWK